MEIQVMGGGCKSCEKLLQFTKEAVAELGIDTDVKYITDMDKIMKAGVISTPALIVNGVVKSSGRVPKPKEIKQLIAG